MDQDQNENETEHPTRKRRPKGTVEKKQTKLQQLHEEWEKAGGMANVDAAVAKKAIAALEKSQKAVTDAEAAVERAQQQLHRRSEELVRIIGGKQGVKLEDGSILVPMSRGETVYYRSRTDGIFGA